MNSLPHGVYESLLDQELHDLLQGHPELRRVLQRIDLEEQPSRYASFVAKVLEQALREEFDPECRLLLCNQLISQIASQPGRDHLRKRLLAAEPKSLLLEITPPEYAISGVPRPETPLAQSSLFTGSPQDPQLHHELQAEMRSADAVDILISFIKWPGLRLLMSAFEDLRQRLVPVRVITTSYMGASDAPAVEWLARMPNVEVRVSYDTERTRLHAKAYHFKRHSTFSTAYIGSANMSHAAMTSGVEWNLKVTAQDMPHILEKFQTEFDTYWSRSEFVPLDADNPEVLRTAIERCRNAGRTTPVFFDLRPHPFQERILEALIRERSIHNRWRNLVIAATGTGKTVIAAFDFKRFYQERGKQARLLFVAHRQEILQQAQATFCNVLRDQNFGQLQVGQHQASRMEHLFCSVSMLSTRRLWEQVPSGFYDFIVVDEVHHGAADSYRPIFDHFSPKVLLGLTATPERMDGQNVAADFGNRFAAEIRLPEALEEKLLCPFHYFGVADPVATDSDNFWRNGRYDTVALEGIYTGAHVLAQQRVKAIIEALQRYEPELSSVKGVGFCVSINHAVFMAEMFNKRGISAAAFVSGVDSTECERLLADLAAGRVTFLFTVDKLSEGVDVPAINVVLFLRPTESMTVFLQQLGRGLRHADDKECLTVLDFVGQAHRRYRIDTKLKALMPRHRFSIDKEVELNFPHLPPGCSIQFDRVSREYVLQNIKENLRNLAIQIPERIKTFVTETGKELTFGNFIRYHDYEPELLLAKETWSGWKAKAQICSTPDDPDLARLRRSLVRIAMVNGRKEATLLRDIVSTLRRGAVKEAVDLAGGDAMRLHYRIWGDAGKNIGISSVEEGFQRLSQNQTVLADIEEVVSWSLDETDVMGTIPKLPLSCPFELHAMYGSTDILAGLGHATMVTSGQRGVGVLHFPAIKAYVLLVTYQKTERDFSPTTMYADYPISRELLHWESQSNTAELSATGQNLIHHTDRGYTILVFARGQKKRNGVTLPFSYLGPADRVKHESERPIKIVWRLRHPMPVTMFEENRKGG